MGILRRRRSGDSGTPAPVSMRSAPQVVDLSPKDVEWMDGLRGSLPGAGRVDLAQTGRVYDDAVTQWLSASPSQRTDPSGHIHAIGVAVGDHLCGRVPGARWAVYSDAEGMDLAVVVGGADGPTVFPTNAVGKRWMAGETGWVPQFVEDMAQQLNALSAEPSAAVQALASFALAHALSSIVPEGGPLIPFAMLEGPQGRSLQRFVGELGESVTRARDHVRASGAQRAAVAWDGYVTMDGRRDDAVLVEASEPGRASVLLAHRYTVTPSGAQPLGGPVSVGRDAPLL